ncbi:MAG: phosphatidylserine decarboxylase family protein [Cyclobacteriaceae bacterium]|nr:phosphatidylserine decarboxylase family protein [Cyclobacteriaceae bacterium]
MRIHREGKNILIFLFTFLVLLNWIIIQFFNPAEALMWILIVGSVLLLLFVLQFFRHPDVLVTEDVQHILAPADGKVVVVEKTIEPEFLKDDRIQISIFMSPVNVHVNRSPMKGVIRYFKYHPGKYLVAWHPKTSIENERTTMVIENSGGLAIVVRQIAGIMARRIRYYFKEGDVLNQGQEFGFIRFGSRLDVFLPLSARINVKPGDNTRAGITILARV